MQNDFSIASPRLIHRRVILTPSLDFYVQEPDFDSMEESYVVAFAGPGAIENTGLFSASPAVSALAHESSSKDAMPAYPATIGDPRRPTHFPGAQIATLVMASLSASVALGAGATGMNMGPAQQPWSLYSMNAASGNEGGGLTAWHHELEQRIEELRALQPDWDTYGGDPPNVAAITWAQGALSLLREINLEPSGIVPSAENGIGIVFYNGDRYADVECFNTGGIFALVDDQRGNPRSWEVANNQADLQKTLEAIRDHLYA